MAFASLADLKEHLNISSSANDGELGLMLDAATDVVRSLVGAIDGDTYTERVAVHDGTAILRHRPTGTVVLNDGAVTGHTVDALAGLVHDIPGAYSTLTVAYPTGSGSVPAAMTLATLIIAAHLWETQRGSAPGGLALQDETVEPFVPGAGFAIPNRARELLAPYTSTAQIA